MKLFISELSYLSEIYRRLTSELLNSSCGAHAAPTESTLRNRELLSRVAQMNARVVQLVQEWEKFRNHIDPPVREEIVSMAAAAGDQAMQLSHLCSDLLRRLETKRHRLEKELVEISRGTRYLESVKPGKTNYPKFIDSMI